ncbi:MAG: tRNA (guanosine-2'-O-)-methyltransferase [Flavobacteriales bacterium]|jgi:tRNA (guanosine-2'-O-)-methyltransferase
MEKLYDFLKYYMTDERDQKFEKVIQGRTRFITCVVENLFQPHNASAVLRSCDCFGIQDVHIIENDNEWKTNKEISMGATKWLNIHQYNSKEQNTVDCLRQLKANGYKIVATTPHENDCEIADLPLDAPVALVFGTELSGVSKEVMDEADLFVRIPMYGFTESFNISVAAALSLYELTQRVRLEGIEWKLTREEMATIKVKWAKQSIRKSEGIIKHFNG